MEMARDAIKEVDKGEAAKPREVKTELGLYQTYGPTGFLADQDYFFN